MRSTSFFAVTLCALSATVFSAPTPELPSLTNTLGSITNPGAGNDNIFKDIANGNGVSFSINESQLHTNANITLQNANGNGNSAGNNNGNNNNAGNGDAAGNGNSISLVKARDGSDLLSGLTNTIGSVTNPTAGSGNTFEGIANGNGNGNGNGNSAGVRSPSRTSMSACS
jgi:hypothetical protein